MMVDVVSNLKKLCHEIILLLKLIDVDFKVVSG